MSKREQQRREAATLVAAAMLGAAGCTGRRRVSSPTVAIAPSASQVDAPRLVAPMSLGDVTQRRPTLRWALPPSADGAVVELCHDRACARVIETLTVRGTSARPATDLPAGRAVFWRARGWRGSEAGQTHGATWSFHVPARDTAVDTSFNPRSDVNGDGFDDVVASAPRYDERSGTYVYRVSVSFGGASGAAAAPAQVIEGWESGDRASLEVASVGDVNGDGYCDVVVGWGQSDDDGDGASRVETCTGTASVFLGGPAGLSTTPQRVLGETEPGACVGGEVAGAGDVNGDGYADVLVAATTASPRGRELAGVVRAYYGGATGIAAAPQWELEGTHARELLGRSIAGAGDVDGDGFGDVAVGALAVSRSSVGVVRVFAGGPSGLSTTPQREIQRPRGHWSFGSSVAGAGDVNGDGYADLAVGAPDVRPDERALSGSVSVFGGSADGVVEAPLRVIEGAVGASGFGRSLAWIRDVDGDGCAELAVGVSIPASGAQGAAMAAQVFHGDPSGVAATPRRVITEPIVGDPRGGPLVGPGDVNGDGFADLCVTFARSNGVYRVTRTGVFPGGASGIAATPLREIVEGSVPE